MSLSAAERETIISFADDEALARIYTAQRPMITKLRKNAAAVEIESGSFEGTAWARFEIPSNLISVRAERKAAPMSPERRKVQAERMRAMRAGKR